ncbi:hypothetical protein CAMGR0001_2482 [Campylobacter gracilis RM3268]|uniref:Uncharacterized protein n=1 Tax=Campylobacter gracilis RM3268 TaxID=553220 RepID=C8PFC9_9BACT|nr:hypothetical protein CAMGR0001_2482 [Campylobacter gracilis RM3268]
MNQNLPVALNFINLAALLYNFKCRAICGEIKFEAKDV